MKLKTKVIGGITVAALVTAGLLHNNNQTEPEIAAAATYTFPATISMGQDKVFDYPIRKIVKPIASFGMLGGTPPPYQPDTMRVDYYLIAKPSGSTATLSRLANDTLELVSASEGVYTIAGFIQAHGWLTSTSSTGEVTKERIDMEARDTVNVRVRKNYSPVITKVWKPTTSTVRVEYSFGTEGLFDQRTILFSGCDTCKQVTQNLVPPSGQLWGGYSIVEQDATLVLPIAYNVTPTGYKDFPITDLYRYVSASSKSAKMTFGISARDPVYKDIYGSKQVKL